jgi:hypothetical protein
MLLRLHMNCANVSCISEELQYSRNCLTVGQVVPSGELRYESLIVQNAHHRHQEHMKPSALSTSAIIAGGSIVAAQETTSPLG